MHSNVFPIVKSSKQESRKPELLDVHPCCRKARKVCILMYPTIVRSSQEAKSHMPQWQDVHSSFSVCCTWYGEKSQRCQNCHLSIFTFLSVVSWYTCSRKSHKCQKCQLSVLAFLSIISWYSQKSQKIQKNEMSCVAFFSIVPDIVRKTRKARKACILMYPTIVRFTQ